MLNQQENKIKKRYKQLIHNNTMYDTCVKIRSELNDPDITLGDINLIGKELTPDQAQEIIGNRVCPRCGTGDNLRCVPVGVGLDHLPAKGYEIYCATQSPDGRLCMYHL